MISRNPLSDLEAIAAMPGLEELAEVLASHDTALRATQSDPLAMLVALAARWPLGGDAAVDSAFRFTAAWEIARASAARVGRQLPAEPPTQGQWRHYRSRAKTGYSDALADALVEPAIEIAHACGLLPPGAPEDWSKPARANSIYADGSVFGSLSDVQEIDGVMRGSRAKHRPREGMVYIGKKGNKNLRGLPVAMVGCHGGGRHQRVVLGVKTYQDGDELAAAMGRIERVIVAARGGVHAVHYDQLLPGVRRRRLMQLGTVPVVEMAMPPSGTSNVPVPPDLQKVKGRKPSTGKLKVKTRVRAHKIRVLVHDTPAGPCGHEVWAVDGALRAVDPGDRPSYVTPCLERTALERRESADGFTFVGHYVVPCAHGDLDFPFDHAGDRPGRSRTRQKNAWAEWVSIIPEADYPVFEDIAGRRSDAESTFAAVKVQLAHGRASKLHLDHFCADLVGAALWTNAVAWDVHAAQHTRCGQHLAGIVAR